MHAAVTTRRPTDSLIPHGLATANAPVPLGDNPPVLDKPLLLLATARFGDAGGSSTTLRERGCGAAALKAPGRRPAATPLPAPAPAPARGEAAARRVPSS